jgi:hypothetical protein
MGKDEDRDLFAIAGGERGIRETPCTVPIYARGERFLEMGEVTYYIPDTRIQGDDTMDVEEPKIEIGLPMKN